MQIEWVDKGRGVALPEMEGAHGFALSHLFDAIFADAYQVGLDTLVWCGGPEWWSELELRAELTRVRQSGRRGLIAVDTLPSVIDGERLYWIRRRGSDGSTVPTAWRRVRDARWYTPQVRWWGVAIRASRLAGRPDRVDWAMARMRQDFGQDGDGQAEYRLAICRLETTCQPPRPEGA